MNLFFVFFFLALGGCKKKKKKNCTQNSKPSEQHTQRLID